MRYPHIAVIVPSIGAATWGKDWSSQAKLRTWKDSSMTKDNVSLLSSLSASFSYRLRHPGRFHIESSRRTVDVARVS